LHLIDDKSLAADIDRLCGPVFLAELRRAHQAYGDALGLTQAKPVPQAAEIAGALLACRSAIRFYARRVVALADEEEPETERLVQRALEPIVEAQEDARRRRASNESEPQPNEEPEIPPLPQA